MKVAPEQIEAGNDETVAMRAMGASPASIGAIPQPMGRENWNQRHVAAEFIRTVDANRFLVAEAANLTPGFALDLAAGEGRNAVWLAEQGWNVRAVDFSDVAMETGSRLAAARKVSDKIDFRDAALGAADVKANHRRTTT